MEAELELRIADGRGVLDDRLQRLEVLLDRQKAVAGLRTANRDLDALSARADLVIAGLRAGGEMLDECARAVIRPVRLLDRIRVDRVAAPGDQVLDRLLRIARLLEMHGEDRCELVAPIGIELLQGLADPA